VECPAEATGRIIILIRRALGAAVAPFFAIVARDGTVRSSLTNSACCFCGRSGCDVLKAHTREKGH
jgi:hypothetical protein